MMVLQENRNNPRLGTYLGSSVKSTENDQKRTFSITKNLSETGAYFTTKKEFDEGSIIDCIVSLGDDSVAFTGEVMRVSEDGAYRGYGVRIAEIDEKDKSMIDDYVRKGFDANMKSMDTEYSADLSFRDDISIESDFGHTYDIGYIKTDGVDSRFLQADFPFSATLEDYDFSYQTEEVKAGMEILSTLEWVEKTSNIMFFGPTGAGKTHLAVGLARKAIEEGYKANYTTMNELVRLLKGERSLPINRYKLDKMIDSRVLIIDDLGFRSLSQNETNLVFEFLGKLYGKTSIIMATDLTFEQLKDTIGDTTVVNLLLDKLTHNIWLRGLIN